MLDRRLDRRLTRTPNLRLNRGLARLLDLPDPQPQVPDDGRLRLQDFGGHPLQLGIELDRLKCVGLSMSALKTSSDSNSTNAKAPAPPGGLSVFWDTPAANARSPAAADFVCTISVVADLSSDSNSAASIAPGCRCPP